MRSQRLDRGALGGILCLGVLLLLSEASEVRASTAPAEETSQEAAQQPRPQAPDFLFGRPTGWVGIRGGWLFAAADSEIYDFTRDQLTIDENDFDAPALNIDVGLFVWQPLDVVVGFAFSRASIVSEYRDFVDADDLPITQDTELTQLKLSGSVKLYLLSRGREVSQLAWVPSAVTPYLGGGGGFLRYRFEQVGDFVDFVDLSIFTDRFESDGWTFSAHAFGGADVKLTRRVFLTTELRYQWADADLERDFVNFDRIDLTGFKLTGGVYLLF